MRQAIVCFMCVVLGALLRAGDMTLPLDRGTILISAEFDRQQPMIPQVTYKVTNQTSSGWRSIRLKLAIGGLCGREPHQVSIPVAVALPYGKAEEGTFPNVHEDSLDDLVKAHQLLLSLSDCTVDIIKAALVSAENDTQTIKGDDALDLTVELKAIQVKRNAELTRQKQLTAERNARLAKQKAEDDAKAAEEQRKTRAACGVIYQNTIDKKIRDLTVREEQQVRACQTLNLYPPR
ncbi:MAG TPA: hypothetical protein VGN17_00300 [Bryobacteraceae bacterium]|jgi:hypothetical protein